MYSLAIINAFLLLSSFTYMAFSSPNVTFLMIGDWGKEGDALTANAKAMGEKAKEINADFVFCLGDNFYFLGVQSTTDPKWKTTFRDVFNATSLINKTFYSILG